MRAVLPTPLLLLIAIALPALALVAGLPSHPRILSVLNDAAHAPVFGGLAVVLCALFERSTRRALRFTYAATFLATLAIGIIIELIQPMLGRGGELNDVWTDAMGAAAGLAILDLARPGHRRLAGVILTFSIGSIAWPIAVAGLGYWERGHQAPALLEMTSPFDWFFIRTHGLEASPVELPEAWRLPDDPTSLRIRIRHDSWRHLALAEPFPDWRGHQRLFLDLTNPEPVPLLLTLRIHDAEHDNARTDRFNRRITVPAGARQEFVVTLADVAAAPMSRHMDMSRIAGLMIVPKGERELAGRNFYVTRIRLE